MTATLTGPDATKALQLYSSLGALGARFDARRVARDIRTRTGRTRLAFALARRIGQAGMLIRVPRPRARGFRARSARSVSSRGGTADPSPARSSVPPRLGALPARRGRVWGG